jgi:hypothetical protein
MYRIVVWHDGQVFLSRTFSERQDAEQASQPYKLLGWRVKVVEA